MPCSRSVLAYCGKLEYTIWREADEAEPYIQEEHEEGLYDIRIVVRYIKPEESTSAVRIKESSLVTDTNEVLLFDPELLAGVDRILAVEFGVGKISVREEMADTLLQTILDEAVYPCRCYCQYSRGPTIVMEIVELLDLPPSNGFD